MKSLSFAEKVERLRQHFLCVTRRCARGAPNTELRAILAEPANAAIDVEVLRLWLKAFEELLADADFPSNLRDEVIFHVVERPNWLARETPQYRCRRELLHFLYAVSKLGDEYLQVLSNFLFRCLNGSSAAATTPTAAFNLQTLFEIYAVKLAADTSQQYIEVVDDAHLRVLKANAAGERFYIGYSRADQPSLALFVGDGLKAARASERFSGLSEVSLRAAPPNNIDSDALARNRSDVRFLKEVISIMFLADAEQATTRIAADLCLFAPSLRTVGGQISLTSMLALSFAFPAILRAALVRLMELFVAVDMTCNARSVGDESVEFVGGLALSAYCAALNLDFRLSTPNSLLEHFKDLIGGTSLSSEIVEGALSDSLNFFAERIVALESPFCVQFVYFFLARTTERRRKSNYLSFPNYFSRIIETLSDPKTNGGVKERFLLYAISFLRSANLSDETVDALLEALYKYADAVTRCLSRRLRALSAVNFDSLEPNERQTYIALCEGSVLGPLLLHLSRLFTERRDAFNTESLVKAITKTETYCRRHAAFLSAAVERVASLLRPLEALSCALNAPGLARMLAGAIRASEGARECKAYLRASSHTTLGSLSALVHEGAHRPKRLTRLERSLEEEEYPFEVYNVRIFSALCVRWPGEGGAG